MTNVALPSAHPKQPCCRLLRRFLIFFVLIGVMISGFSYAQDGCNTLEIFPMPALEGNDLTVRAFRSCPNQGEPLFIEITVVDNSIRVGVQCVATPLLVLSCQVGEAPLPITEAGTYTITMHDLGSDQAIFSTNLTVSPVVRIPTLNRSGVGLLVLVLLLIGIRVLQSAGKF